MNTKPKSVKKFQVFMMLTMIICLVFLSLTLKPITVEATGNSKIHSIEGNEEHVHSVLAQVGTKYEGYSENIYRDTGIKVYTPNNSGVLSTGSDIKLDSTSVYFDFTSCNILYAPNNETSYTISYKFEILNSNGDTFWYVKYNISEDENENIFRTFDINGDKSTSQSSPEFVFAFNCSEFGKQIVNLYNGEFTYRITREYAWLMEESNFCMYGSTHTMRGNILVDSVDPVINMKGYETNQTVENGDFVNERVVVSASDMNFSKLYYKTPNGSSFLVNLNSTYTLPNTIGEYTFYVVDKVGNTSEEYSIYYDNISPKGQIMCNGKVVETESYINKSFLYTVSDTGCGIDKIYCKSPVSSNYQEYVSGTIIPANTGDGFYTFYAVDKAGNISDISSVYLETETPIFEMYRNGNLVYSSPVTKSGVFETDVYLNRSDILKLIYDSSSNNVNCNFALGENINLSVYQNNTYTINVVTPTGIEANYKFNIIDEEPYIVVNNKKYESGSVVYVSEDTTVTFEDDETILDSGDTGIKVVSKGNSESTYFIKHFESNVVTLTTDYGTETLYHLTVNDKAGNESTYIVVVDKKPAEGKWISDNIEIENNSHTNKEVIFNFDKTNSTAVYSINENKYQPYNGEVLSQDGVYEVILSDLANNKSSFKIYIDTVKPVGQLYSDYKPVESKTITNGYIYFTWEENCTASVNGETYKKNTVIGEDGAYKFTLTDEAGNTSEYIIEIDKSVNAYASTGNGVITNEDVYIYYGENVNISVERNGEKYSYYLNQTLTEEGSYKVVIKDCYDNQKTIMFEIVKTPKTYLDYKLTGSTELISVRKDGKEIDWQSTKLNFKEDGTYFVTAKSEGKEYTFSLVLDTTAPNLLLEGVENGKVASLVTINGIDEEGEIEVYKDGELIEYVIGEQIVENGDYEVKVTDKLGNTSTYKFSIDYRINKWSALLILLVLMGIVAGIVLVIMKNRRVFKK